MEGSDPKPNEVNMHQPGWHCQTVTRSPRAPYTSSHLCMPSAPSQCPLVAVRATPPGLEFKHVRLRVARSAPGVGGITAVTDTCLSACALVQFARRMVKQKRPAGEFLRTSYPASPSKSHRQEGLEPVPSAAGMKEKLHINFRCFAELGMGRWF